MTVSERHRAIALTIGVAWLCLLFAAALGPVQAQPDMGFQSSRPEGHYGVGHDRWHHLYSRLRKMGGMRNGEPVWHSCCNGEECRPTSARYVGGGWEVMVNGVWRPVDPKSIINSEALTALGIDRGELSSEAHVCAQANIYCVILPSTGG